MRKDNWDFIIGLGFLAILFGYGVIAVDELGLLKWICALPCFTVLGLMSLLLLADQLGWLDRKEEEPTNVILISQTDMLTVEKANIREILEELGLTEEDIDDILTSS